MSLATAVLRAFGIIVGSSIGGGVLGAVAGFVGHYLSGEAQVASSGQPWLMVGAMLFVPVGVLVGLVCGIAFVSFYPK